MKLLFYIIVLLISTGLIIAYLVFRRKRVSYPQVTRKHVFGIISDTKRGEKVRSKAEKTVADYLFSENIDYIYEKTIMVGKRKKKSNMIFSYPLKMLISSTGDWKIQHQKSKRSI